MWHRAFSATPALGLRSITGRTEDHCQALHDCSQGPTLSPQGADLTCTEASPSSWSPFGLSTGLFSAGLMPSERCKRNSTTDSTELLEAQGTGPGKPWVPRELGAQHCLGFDEVYGSKGMKLLLRSKRRQGSPRPELELSTGSHSVSPRDSDCTTAGNSD